MKRPYLVCHDYGAGGSWAFMLAESAEDIKRRYPRLVVVTARPSWLNEALEDRLRSTMTIDIEDGSHPFVLALLPASRGRASFGGRRGRPEAASSGRYRVITRS